MRITRSKGKRKPKIPLGRPVMGAEAKERYQVMLEPTVAEKLRRIGDDNLSAGIAKAAARLPGGKSMKVPNEKPRP